MRLESMTERLSKEKKSIWPNASLAATFPGKQDLNEQNIRTVAMK